MRKFIKYTMIAAVTTVLVIGTPDHFAVAQAPTTQLAVSTETGTGTVTLLPNQLYQTTTESGKTQQETEDAEVSAGQTEAKEKLAVLAQNRAARVRAEKLARIRLRKKRLAAKRRRQEAKRKREIQACCGVAAGTADCRILERIVEAEAGGEDFTGKLLVANVVLNRVKSKAFPSTIKGVVFAHRGSRYQFSPISDGRYYTVTVSKSTKKAVAAALNGKDPSQGALYFMERASADSSNASWFDRALTRLFRYGCHEFFLHFQ